MKRALALAIACMLLATATAVTAFAAPKTGQVRVRYVPPKDSKHEDIYNDLQERRALERLQEFLSPESYCLDPFHGIHFLRQPGKNRRLIAGTGADLQHMFVAIEFQQGGHKAHREGLADSLAVTDGQGMVGIGLVEIAVEDKLMAGDSFHHLQH